MGLCSYIVSITVFRFDLQILNKLEMVRSEAMKVVVVESGVAGGGGPGLAKRNEVIFLSLPSSCPFHNWEGRFYCLALQKPAIRIAATASDLQPFSPSPTKAVRVRPNESKVCTFPLRFSLVSHLIWCVILYGA